MANGNGKNRKRKRFFYIGGSILLIVVAVGVLVAFTRGGTKIDPSKLGKVERGDLAKSVVATGKIEPITKVELKSKASGIVEKWYADAGDKVKEGQVLVELDRQQIQAAVRESRAALAAAEANERAAMADVIRAKADAEGPDVPLLYRAYQRAQKMAKDGVVSEAALDDAQKAYEMAVNKRDVARAQLTVNDAKLIQAKAQVQQARATLDRAEEDLRYATITSPITGVVLSRDVEIGDAVSSILVLGSQATLVMTLGDMHQVYIKGKVDESDIGQVHVGQNARIKVESYPNHSFVGTVTKIYPMGVEKDNVTTFEVRVSVENPEGLLKADMSANAEIVQEEHKGVLTIPEGAVVYNNKRETFVQIPDAKAPKGVRQIPVKLGISNGARTEVLSGLSEGQQVVLQS